MKKVALLLLGLFLFGCGGGGNQGATTPSTNATANDGGSINVPPAGAMSPVTIKLIDVDSKSTAKAVGSLSLDDQALVTKARVVVRQIKITPGTPIPTYAYVYDEEGYLISQTQNGTKPGKETKTEYRRVIDTNILQGSISFTTPMSIDANDTFNIDVLTYVPGVSGAPNIMSQFGKAVNTSSNNTTDIEIKSTGTTLSVPLTDIVAGSATFVVPELVRAESNYNVKITTFAPLANYYELAYIVNSTFTSSFEEIVAATPTFHKYGNSGYDLNFVGPSVTGTATSNIYFFTKFYINSDMLNKEDATDKVTKWIRTTPSAGSSGETQSGYFAPLFAF